MPMVGTPVWPIVPPTTTRDTFGSPNGSASSRLLSTLTRRPGFRPVLSVCSMFSFTDATVASMTAFSSAAVSPQRGRKCFIGDSVETPLPPKRLVFIRSPSKSRKIVWTAPWAARSLPGR